MTNDPTSIISTVGATLVAEGWTCTEVHPLPADVVARARTADRTVRLMVVQTAGQPTVADLTGHPFGHLSAAIWSLSITEPTAAHLVAIARAAVADRLRAVLSLARLLQKSGWKPEADESVPGALWQMTSARSRTLIRMAGTEEAPGGWVVSSDGLRAEATDSIPPAVLAVLAADPCGESTPTSSPAQAFAAERSELSEPDAS